MNNDVLVQCATNTEYIKLLQDAQITHDSEFEMQ